MLTRRQFFQSLAASVVAAGMPLPVGFPEGAYLHEDIEADLNDIIFNINPVNVPFANSISRGLYRPKPDWFNDALRPA